MKKQIAILIIFILLAGALYIHFLDHTINGDTSYNSQTENQISNTNQDAGENMTNTTNTNNVFERYVEYAKQNIKPIVNNETWEMLEKIYDEFTTSTNDTIPFTSSQIKTILRNAKDIFEEIIL